MNIDEGSGEITVEVGVGSFTLNTIVGAVTSALLSQATLDYTVTANRTTRKITISASTPFDLLTNSGSNVGTSIWSLLGFDTSTDKTGLSSYTSDFASGSQYVPQFFLQSFVDPNDFQTKQQSTKNVASDGTTVEIVNFGIGKFIEFDIKFITSRTDISDGINILHNSEGLEDARTFLQDITELNEFEFMPDATDASTFFRCILETMPGFDDGTGYKLRELFNQNLRDVYETGVMKLRVIE